MAKQDAKIFIDGATASPIVNFSGASDLVTESIDLSDWDGSGILYFWGDLSPTKQNLTIQVSDDEAKWFDYKDEAKNVKFDDYFFDDKMVHKYIRIQYFSNGYSGNITFKFVQV